MHIIPATDLDSVRQRLKSSALSCEYIDDNQRGRLFPPTWLSRPATCPGRYPAVP